jgi:hypothetical protein
MVRLKKHYGIVGSENLYPIDTVQGGAKRRSGMAH